MSNEIVPYHGRDDIAYVNRSLATKRDQLKKSSSHVRLSDMFIGRYGVLGYVELALTERPNMSGIIEVPNRLVAAMRKVPGMMGYISEVVFERNQDFTTVYGRENINHPALDGTVLFDTEYFWWSVPGFRTVDMAEVNEEGKRLEGVVIDFISGFDSSLDRFVPEERRPTYSSLQMLGPGQLEQS